MKGTKQQAARRAGRLGGIVVGSIVLACRLAAAGPSVISARIGARRPVAEVLQSEVA